MFMEFHDSQQVNYHPSLVWTEIMSFIKGSFASLTKRKGHLDKESYEQLGRKQAPNFTGSRDKVSLGTGEPWRL